MYTNAIATAKLIAVTSAMIPEGICLLLLRLTDFATPAMFSELTFVAAFFTSNGDVSLVLCFKFVLETSIIKK